MKKDKIILSVSILLGCIILGVFFYITQIQQVKIKMQLEGEYIENINADRRANCLSNVNIDATGGDGFISYSDWKNNLKSRNDCYIRFPK